MRANDYPAPKVVAPVLRSGLRQLPLGAVAVAVIFGVGSLIGHHSG